MEAKELRRRLDVLQRVRRKVDALSSLGLVSEIEWRALNGVFNEEVIRTLEANPVNAKAKAARKRKAK